MTFTTLFCAHLQLYIGVLYDKLQLYNCVLDLTGKLLATKSSHLLSVSNLSCKSSMLNWSRLWWCALGVLLQLGGLYTSGPTSL